MPTDESLCRYAVSARTGNTAVTIDHCYGALWNPHATKAIVLISLVTSKITGMNATYAQRITTKGTVGSTVTPDIDNHFDRLQAPVSGAVLDLAPYSVQPTRAGPDSFRIATSQNNAGATQDIWFSKGLTIPAGTGLGIFQGLAGTAGQFDLSFVWDE
jgi:hypothetical protein